MMRILIAALILLCATAVSQANEIECHANDGYTVVGVLTPSRLGNHYYVAERTAPDAPLLCAPGQAFTQDLTVDDSDMRVEALTGKFLALKIYAGAELFLRVHDLSGASDPLLDVEARDIESNADGIHYFEMTETRADPSTCPQFDLVTADGMDAALANERFFNFATGAVEPLPAVACYAVP